MFFILSKVLVFLLSPLVWIVLILLYAFLSKNRKNKKYSFLTALSLLLVFSNSLLVNEAFLLWEDRPVAISQLKSYETAIVLTGVSSVREDFPDRVFFDKGADRLLHTVQLYRLGKIRKILISGGSGSVINRSLPEARQMERVFLYCGIPAEDIILEEQSRNTAESSVFTKRITDSLNLGSEFLLVTSAFHMPRSMGCFKKAGLTVRPYPVDLYSRRRNYNLSAILMPSEYALYQWSVLLHEVTGYIVYKIMGYS